LLIFALSIFVAGGLYDQRHSIGCLLLGNAAFQEISPSIYTDGNLAYAEVEDLLYKLDAARDRNNNTFGDTIAQPTILITSDAQIAVTYGANETGTIHKTIYGQCIIVGPKGHSVDVMAHELLHAELATRIGVWATFFELPIWFDEGLALMVDYRSEYEADLIDLPHDAIERVKKLTSAQQFYGQENTLENYQAAKLAVAEIFETIDETSLYERLERIKQGESFESVFEY
ncbi:MAG: hypothetical protein AB3N28_09205, partial [Kordiimonas sp.]